MNNKNFKSSFSSKSFRVGGYTLAVSIALLVIVIVINLFVSALPSAYTKLDLSSKALFSISEETEKIVKDINEKVTVYFVASNGQEDMVTDELLGRYTSLNSNISVKYIDPATNPNFTAKYTDQTLSPSSLIIVSEKRSKVIDYNEIYTREYSEEDYYNWYYYGIEPQGTPYFKGEGVITSAIKYVTEKAVPTIYVMGGHGEKTFDSGISEYLKIDNYVVNELSLLTEDNVPDDASAVVCIAPTNDISSEEKTKLDRYLDNGGTFILFTMFSTQEMPNLFSVTSDFGAQFNKGLILEGNKNYYLSGRPYELLPKISDSVISEKLTDKTYIYMSSAHGITKSEDIADNISYQSLLKTSGAAYLKEDVNNIETLERLESDPYGTYDIGVLLTDMTTNGKVVWFSSPFLIDSAADTNYVSGGNSNFFLTTLAHLCDKPVSVSIAAKNMQIQSLILDEFSANAWMTVLVIILPAGILGGGFLYWYKRRKA